MTVFAIHRNQVVSTAEASKVSVGEENSLEMAHDHWQ